MKNNPSPLRRRKPLLIAASLAAVLATAAFVHIRIQHDPIPRAAVFHVERGPLSITVTESGTIQARDMVIIKNEVEGRRAIITLVPEGRRVSKGDLLVELDASSLIDQRLDQEIRVQNTEAAFINAQESLAVTENQAQSDMDRARLTLKFARNDLVKYNEGDYPSALMRAEAQITLAEEELARARERLEWSRNLAAENFISKTELQADELMEKKRALDLELARNQLRLLTDFEHQRSLAQMESDVQQAEMALERVTRKARADIVQAQANLKAREAEYNRQKDRLDRLAEQIAKTRILAPMDGQVIYATSAQRRRWNVEPLAEGQEVRERQSLIHLPATASSMAEITIHESNLEKISLDLPAIITVDALPGRQYSGTVARIAPLPDAQSMWMTPDLKVYNTDIHIDSRDEALRPGMSCKARIIVAEYEDALFVPLQTVTEVAGEPTVYVVNGRSIEPRVVETGLDNNRMIRILSGLEEGDAVLLAPPLHKAAVDERQNMAPMEQDEAVPSSVTDDRAVPEPPGISPPDDVTAPHEDRASPPSSDTGHEGQPRSGQRRQGARRAQGTEGPASATP